MRKVIWASVGCFACLHGGVAWGARRGFRPQFETLTGALQFQSEYRKNTEETATKLRTQKRLDMRETLQLQTQGFSYSPKFFTFIANAGLGLGQAEIESGAKQISTKNALEDYQFQGVFLPTHPYNLEVYSFRETPLFTTNYATLQTSRVQRSGTAFNYKERPYFLELRYDFSEREGDVPSFYDTYQSFVEYFTDEFVTGMTMSHTNDIVGDEASRESSYDGHAELHDLFAGKGDYSGTWSYLKKDHEDADSRSGSLRHYLDVDIRDDLEGIFELTQDQQSNTSIFGGKQDDSFSGLQDARMLLTHHLFKSLTTVLNGREKIRRASDSTNRNELVELTSTYKKRIPGSSRLTLGLGVANYKNWNDIVEGGTPFIEEQFVAVQVGKKFTTAIDINVDSLQVAVLRDARFPNDYVELEEGIHYRIRRTLQNGALELELKEIPDSVSFFNEDQETYKIRLRYTVIKSDTDSKAVTWKYVSKLEILDNLLELYYNRNATIQERMSRQPSQVLIDDAILDDSLGMVIKQDPVSVKWEYARIIGERQTLRKWSVVAELRDDIRLAKYLTLELQGYGENANIFEDRTAGVTMPDYTLMELFTDAALATELPGFDANLKYGISYEYNRNLKERVQFSRPSIEGIYLADDETTRTLTTESTLRNYISLNGAIPERRLFYSLLGARVLTSGEEDEKRWELISRIRYELGLVKMKLTMRYDSTERTSDKRGITTTDETQATLTVSRDIF